MSWKLLFFGHWHGKRLWPKVTTPFIAYIYKYMYIGTRTRRSNCLVGTFSSFWTFSTQQNCVNNTCRDGANSDVCTRKHIIIELFDLSSSRGKAWIEYIHRYLTYLWVYIGTWPFNHGFYMYVNGWKARSDSCKKKCFKYFLATEFRRNEIAGI
jgi:hypothetical protein